MSRKQAESYVPSNLVVMISIRDPGKRKPHLHPSIESKLYLEFDDDTEASVGLSVNEVPDLMLNHDNGGRIMVNGNELCDYNDAHKVYKFTQYAMNRPEPISLVIHCEMGISRSAAVAQYVHQYLRVPMANADKFSRPNLRLFRLLEKVHRQLPPKVGDIPEHCLPMSKRRAPI